MSALTHTHEVMTFTDGKYIVEFYGTGMKIAGTLYNAVNVTLRRVNSIKVICGVTRYCRWNSLDGVNIPIEILKHAKEYDIVEG